MDLTLTLTLASCPQLTHPSSSHVPLLHRSYNADHAFTRVLVYSQIATNCDVSKALRQCAQLIGLQAPERKYGDGDNKIELGRDHMERDHDRLRYP